MGRRFFVLAGCIAAVLVSALPATANNEPTTGTRIGLFAPPATFAADTPFYVEHGFFCGVPTMGQCMGGGTHFYLYVDGALQQSKVDDDLFEPALINHRFLTNFPSGLPAGIHTFAGVWVFDGVVVITRNATITFA